MTDFRDETFRDGQLVDAVEYTPAQLAAAQARQRQHANLQDLTGKARAALTVNATYLTTADTATNAQVRTQVERLTRQCSGIIRELGAVIDTMADLLDSTDGT